MSHFIDLTGKQMGQWTVSHSLDRVHWFCRCACGTERSVRGMYLRSGKSRSCGCYRPNACGGSPAGENHPTTVAAKAKHGAFYHSSRDYWYRRAAAIQIRARETGVDFCFTSIQECASYIASIAPVHCPVFGWTLKKEGALVEQSASVDRIATTKGYARGNLQVISMLANRMKNNADFVQLGMFADWIKQELPKWI